MELSRIHDSERLHELMAAHDCDGVGIIARWGREDGGWRVWAVDTEKGEPVTEFREGEPVPPEPPIETRTEP